MKYFFCNVNSSYPWNEWSEIKIQFLFWDTGCSLNIVFFSKFFKCSGLCLSLFSLCISTCTQTRQVEHQRCSRTGRVQKNHKILRKNTIFNEHPIQIYDILFLIRIWILPLLTHGVLCTYSCVLLPGTSGCTEWRANVCR